MQKFTGEHPLKKWDFNKYFQNNFLKEHHWKDPSEYLFITDVFRETSRHFQGSFFSEQSFNFLLTKDPIIKGTGHLVCRASQVAGFYIERTLVVDEIIYCFCHFFDEFFTAQNSSNYVIFSILYFSTSCQPRAGEFHF